MIRQPEQILQWVYGLFACLLGAVLLTVPPGFLSPENLFSDFLRALVGLCLLLSGILMLIGFSFVGKIRISSPILAVGGTTFLIAGTILMVEGGLLRGIYSLIPGLSLFAALFFQKRLPVPTSSGSHEIREASFLFVSLGVLSALSGILILYQVGDLANQDQIQSAVGLAFLVLGFLLAFVELFSFLPTVRIPFGLRYLIRLLNGVVFLLFILLVAVPNSHWDLAVLYLFFGLALVLPERSLVPNKTNSFHVQVTLLIVLAVVVPLILVAAITNRIWAVQAGAMPTMPPERVSAIVLGILLVAAVIVILASYLLGRRISRSLERLLEALHETGNAQFSDLSMQGQLSVIDHAALVVKDLQAQLRKETALRFEVEKRSETQQNDLDRYVAERTNELAVGNQRLKAVLDALPVGVIIADGEGKIIQTNEMFDSIWGSDAPMVESIDAYQVYQGRWADTGRELRSEDWALARAVQHGEISFGEVIDIEKFDGTRGTILNSAAPIIDTGGEVDGAVAVVEDITHRRELEMLARESARTAHRSAVQTEAIFNALTDAVLVYDQSGIVQQANPQAIALFGFDPLHFSGDQILQRLSLSDETGVALENEQTPSRRALSGEILVNERLRFINPRGRRYTVLASASPIYIGKESVGIVTVWHDITEREKLLDEIRRQQDLLARLVEEAPAAIAFLVGREHRYSLVNAAYSKVARGKGDLLGRTIAEVWPEIAGDLIPIFDHVFDTGEPFHQIDQQYRVLRDGKMEENFFTFNLTPIISRKGHVEGVMILANEVTEEIQSRRAVEEERLRMQAIIENAPEAIVLIDGSEKVLMVNPAVKPIIGKDGTGLSVNEWLGGVTVFNPDGTECRVDEIPVVRAVREGAVSEDIELIVRNEAGDKVPILANASPVKDTKGQVTGAVMIFQDITGRKTAEKELADYAQQLQRSNRELEQFAFIASHDLQEPLRKIHAFGERLQSRMQDRMQAEEHDFLARMMNAASRMQTMIEDLLAFSRVTTKAQPFVSVDLYDVTKEVLSDLEIQIERTNARVEVGSLPSIEADRLQMRQLIQNLVGNALKYHKKDVPPVVVIEGEVTSANDSRGRRKIARLRVIDNGIGFDVAYLEQIFRPFERLHGRSEYEGSGMGLPICRKIVERHGGMITASSKPGEGAIFIVDLPLTQNSAEN